MAIISFRIFCAQNQIATSYRSRSWKISTAETKILVVLCYYAIFGIIALSFFAISSAEQEEFINAIEEYFICEGAGSQMECDRSQFEQYTYSGLVITTFVLLGFLPCVNLIFVIKWGAGKHFFHGIWVRWFRGISSKLETVHSKAETVETTIE